MAAILGGTAAAVLVTAKLLVLMFSPRLSDDEAGPVISYIEVRNADALADIAASHTGMIYEVAIFIPVTSEVCRELSVRGVERVVVMSQAIRCDNISDLCRPESISSLEFHDCEFVECDSRPALTNGNIRSIGFVRCAGSVDVMGWIIRDIHESLTEFVLVSTPKIDPLLPALKSCSNLERIELLNSGIDAKRVVVMPVCSRMKVVSYFEPLDREEQAALFHELSAKYPQARIENRRD